MLPVRFNFSEPSVMSAPKPPYPPDWNLRLLGERRSASAEAAFKAEMKRVRAMTIKERMIEALEMSQRFSWIQPTPIKKPR